MQDTLRKFFDNFNTDLKVFFDEAMSRHTSLKIGGPADAFVIASSKKALAELVQKAGQESIPVHVIGGGANLLVGDRGVRGIVASSLGLAHAQIEEDGSIYSEAGMDVVRLCAIAKDKALSGLEFAAGLPGSLGGAVYMNARCYGKEFADILSQVDYFCPGDSSVRTLKMDRAGWAYKKTPFMPGGEHEGSIVLASRIKLVPGTIAAIEEEMTAHEADRRKKGHFDYPSAGSFFKNNHAFGRPSGAILDELGFRGRRKGGAMVNPKHANIFVNASGATALDMLALMEEAQDAARKAFGFELEPELVLLGEF